MYLPHMYGYNFQSQMHNLLEYLFKFIISLFEVDF